MIQTGLSYFKLSQEVKELFWKGVLAMVEGMVLLEEYYLVRRTEHVLSESFIE